MRNRKTLIGFALIVAVLVLGVGYAAITGVNPTISGSAAVDNVDLKVVFTNDTDSDTSGCPNCENVDVTATAVDGELTAEIEVVGLTRVGDVVTATYTLRNDETDVAATITESDIDVDKDDYFEVTTDVGAGFVIQPGATHEVIVTVEVIKTPILEANSTTTLSVQLAANPVEPTP